MFNEKTAYRYAHVVQLFFGIRNWYILVANVFGIYMIFAGIPDWLIWFDWIAVADGNWFLRFLYVMLPWTFIWCIGGIILSLPFILVDVVFQKITGDVYRQFTHDVIDRIEQTQ